MEKILKIKLIISAVVVCILVTVLGLALVEKYTPSETMRALDGYYDVAEDEAVVILENEIYSEEHALLRDGGIYLSFAMVKEFFTDKFYLDEEEGVLSYVRPGELIRVEVNQSSYYINEELIPTEQVVLWRAEEVYYVSLAFVSEYADMQYVLYENPNRVVINYHRVEYLYYDTMEETPLRVEPDIKSDILMRFPANERLYYIAGTGSGGSSFIKVMAPNGIYGYVQNKYLGESYHMAMDSSYSEPEGEHSLLEAPVLLGWHQVTVPKANDNLEQVVEHATGLNVISPTWYRLTDTQGGISSLADAGYVERAHAMGLQVWALIDNFDSSVDTYELLSSTAARTALIENMMQEAATYGFDGWNLDFETLASKTGVHYVQFIKELSVRCRKEGIILSVDNYVPAAYNAFYGIEEQGRFADYVIIMAYDEHYSGGNKAGSVASIGFLKKAVKDTLAMVPKEQIVMGVPFYTRLWAEKEGSLSSEALTMNGAADVLKRRKIEAKWNEETAQNYAEYEENGATYKIWLEDVHSIDERMKVIDGAQLAGVAAWRLGYETEEIWPIIQHYLSN